MKIGASLDSYFEIITKLGPLNQTIQITYTYAFFFTLA